MQIVGKVRKVHFDTVKKTITDRVRGSVPESVAAKVIVKSVFPGLVTGRRAGMFTVDLPDHVSPKVVTSVIDSLRGDDSVEYAEIPAAKRPE